MFFLGNNFLFSLEKDFYESDLAVIIMVKDEADVIIPTLQPLVEGGVSCFFVYDTGSQDGTQSTISSYFKTEGIEHFYLIEEPFVDFATSRNRCIELAENIFPYVTFFLMVDAEWYINGVDYLLGFCAKNKHYIPEGFTGSCYGIRLLTIDDNISNYSPRLFRREKSVRYHGVVHETIKDLSSGMLPDSVFFEYKPSQKGVNKSKERFRRDYILLKNYLENNPNDERTLFYLAQTCQFLGEWEEAIFYYQKRADIGVISEERYLALYRIGCAIDHIIYKAEKHKKITPYSRQDAINYYLAAHTMLPHRAEPLVRLAIHYMELKQLPVAYLFACRAVQLSYPYNDRLFIEKKLYDNVRYDILGQCALYVGEYEIGKNAVLKALEGNPDAPHLLHNLAVYQRHFL